MGPRGLIGPPGTPRIFSDQQSRGCSGLIVV